MNKRILKDSLIQQYTIEVDHQLYYKVVSLKKFKTYNNIV